METAIHDDREARRRRIFCDSCTLNDDFYKGNFILKLINLKKFPPAAASHIKIVHFAWVSNSLSIKKLINIIT